MREKPAVTSSSVGRVPNFTPTFGADMAFISELSPEEIAARLEQRGYRWDRKRDRLDYWGSYGFFYEPLLLGGFRIAYTRGDAYDMMDLRLQAIEGGSFLRVKKPFGHTNGRKNAAVEIIELHLLRQKD